MLKLKAIELENEIEKTDKINSPTEARGHVQHLERKLIKVMPMMNLMSDLVKFSRMFEDQKNKQPGTDSLVMKQEESIKVGIVSNHAVREEWQHNFQLVLCEIHQLESDILEMTSGVSSNTYQLVE